MDELWVQLGVVLLLVIINAAFAGTELAMVSLREGQLQRLESRTSSWPRSLATIQIGITLAGFLASAAAAVSLAEPLEEPLGFLGAAAGPVSIVAVTLALSYVTLVLGELAPKRIAMQRAERWGLVMARPLWAVSLIDGAFEIADRTLGEILVPRRDVFVVDTEWSCQEALTLLAMSGHSRAPIAAGRNLDRVTGVVHLRQLQQGRRQMVLVIDEHDRGRPPRGGLHHGGRPGARSAGPSPGGRRGAGRRPVDPPGSGDAAPGGDRARSRSADSERLRRAPARAW
jgi:putative hemolysin